jgi:hypothetical protein
LARLPLPTGGEHLALDPNAELAVGDGEVRVTIPRFSLSHDKFQAADSAKYLIFSTRQSEMPRDRPVTFAVDLAVRNVGGGTGRLPSGNGRIPGVRPGGEPARVLRLRHCGQQHPDGFPVSAAARRAEAHTGERLPGRSDSVDIVTLHPHYAETVHLGERTAGMVGSRTRDRRPATVDQSR